MPRNTQLPQNYRRVAEARLHREPQVSAPDDAGCVRRRAFVVTTDSRHTLPVYPNLAREMKPTAINQLWLADITFIRLRTEFVYLAAVLDAISRRVASRALGRTLEAGGLRVIHEEIETRGSAAKIIRPWLTQIEYSG